MFFASLWERWFPNIEVWNMLWGNKSESYKSFWQPKKNHLCTSWIFRQKSIKNDRKNPSSLTTAPLRGICPLPLEILTKFNENKALEMWQNRLQYRSISVSSKLLTYYGSWAKNANYWRLELFLPHTKLAKFRSGREYENNHFLSNTFHSHLRQKSVQCMYTSNVTYFR